MNKERMYELDWLRVLAVSLVLFYHVGMIFVPWKFHIKNDETSTLLQYVMVWAHQWRMPLLLFVSGAATLMAVKNYTTGRFLLERHKRLFIPVLLAFFVIVPPQIYIEKINQYSSFSEFYKTVFQFVSYPKGSFSWHHLWFVVYLLTFTMISLPVLLMLKRNPSGKIMTVLSAFFSKRGSFIIPLLIIIFSQALLLPYFPEETHDLKKDWAYFTLYFLFFLFGILMTSNHQIWKAVKDQRHLNMILALTSLAVLWWAYWVPDYHMGDDFYWIKFDTLWHTTRICTGWFWVIAILGYGQVVLNFNKPYLKHLNEAAFPFYILHQTVIIVIGYFIIQWGTGLWTKFWVISFLSFSISILIYWFWIRPFNMMRFLFGMKLKKKTVVEKEPESVEKSPVFETKI